MSIAVSVLIGLILLSNYRTTIGELHQFALDLTGYWPVLMNPITTNQFTEFQAANNPIERLTSIEYVSLQRIAAARTSLG